MCVPRLRLQGQGSPDGLIAGERRQLWSWAIVLADKRSKQLTGNSYYALPVYYDSNDGDDDDGDDVDKATATMMVGRGGGGGQ